MKRIKKIQTGYIIYVLLIFFFCILLLFVLKFGNYLHFHIIGNMLIPRAAHSALYFDNKVLYVGGVTHSEQPTAELYDLKNKKNLNLYKLQDKHIYPGLYKNSKNEIIVLDNNSIEKINLKTNRTDIIADNPFNLDSYIGTSQNVQITEDTILVTGGLEQPETKFVDSKIDSKEPGLPTKKAYIYDINNYKILKTLSMNYPHSGHSLVKLDNGNILVVGGISNSRAGALAIEEFDINTQTFKIAGKLNIPRKNFLIVKNKNLIFIIAGEEFDKSNWKKRYLVSENSNIIEVFDTQNKTTKIVNQNLFSERKLVVNNLNTFVKMLNNDNILFIITQRGFPSRKIIYSTKRNKILENHSINIGLYPNIIGVNDYLLISGGEDKYNLINLIFNSKTCSYGQICTLKNSRKIIKLK